MQFRSTICVLAALAFNVVTADIDFENWAPPSGGDIRGPCPALNSLANHHILPHDGRNITAPELIDIMGQVFNLSPELAAVIADLAIATNDPSADFFDLNHLNKHSAFEHDGSLSRVDYAFSGEENIATFDKATFKRFFDRFNGSTYIDLPAAAAARYAQIQHSRQHTPGFTYNAIHQITSYAETIKYMKTMIDDTNRTKTEFVRILFEEERLPFLEGWRPPREQVKGFFMAQFVLEEALATPEKSLWFGEGKPPTNDTTFDIPQCPFKRA